MKINKTYIFNQEKIIANAINEVINSCVSYRIILGQGANFDVLMNGRYTNSKIIFTNSSDAVCKSLLVLLCNACHKTVKCDNLSGEEELAKVKEINKSGCFLCISWKI